jgi:hypothetical protein
MSRKKPGLLPGFCTSGLWFQSRGHLFQDRLGRPRWFRSLGNGPSNDKIACPLPQGIRRRGDALLVADSGAGGTDAGNHQHAFGACDRAQPRHLLRRADKAAYPGLKAHLCQQFHLLGGGTG